MLRRALSEGEPDVRLVAARVLHLVGHPEDVGTLCELLSDVDATVASVAFEALAEIGRRYDLTIE
jgi:HEAT repeat protein